MNIRPMAGLVNPNQRPQFNPNKLPIMSGKIVPPPKNFPNIPKPPISAGLVSPRNPQEGLKELLQKVLKSKKAKAGVMIAGIIASGVTIASIVKNAINKNNNK